MAVAAIARVTDDPGLERGEALADPVADPARDGLLVGAELEGVSEVFSVAGQYDLVALVRVRENDDLARVISEKMRKLPGIKSSETLIAFKVYSKQDIEAAFSLGLD